jgi:hypothetical protein
MYVCILIKASWSSVGSLSLCAIGLAWHVMQEMPRLESKAIAHCSDASDILIE